MNGTPRTVALALCVAILLVGCAAGQVPPVTGRVCEGVPPRVCARVLDEAEAKAQEVASGVVGIEIRCAVTTCTEASGEMSVKVTYADGRTEAWGEGWAAAPAAPVAPVLPPGQTPAEPTPLPIEPTCVGLNRDDCLEMAAEGLADAQSGGVAPVSVLVRCMTTCTEASGDGETVIRYADGSSSSSGWAYRSE